MEYTWKFDDGTTDTREIDENAPWGQLILETDREWENGERKNRYHFGFSMDEFDDYEGTDIADDWEPLDDILEQEGLEKLFRRISQMTDVQKRRLRRYLDGMSTYKIADLEGVNHNAVSLTIHQIRNRLKDLR